jgi:prepilin-type N-terminal cleavage/methylation domain-containing protein
MLMNFFCLSRPPHRRSGERGFSLVELLIVIGIIMIMSAVVLNTTKGVRQKARDVQRTTDLQSITIALALYQGKYKTFPCTFQTSFSEDFLQFLVDEGYLEDNPQDPINEGLYRYGYNPIKDSPTGECGDGAYIWYYMETANKCTFGAQINPNHCHYFYPAPLNCSDPFDKQDSNGTIPECMDLIGD